MKITNKQNTTYIYNLYPKAYSYALLHYWSLR